MNDARGGDKLLPSLLLLLQVGMDLPQECMDLPQKRTFLAREQATFGGFQHFKRLFHPARGDESSGLQAQKPGDGLFLVSTWNRREESFGNIQGDTWFIRQIRGEIAGPPCRANFGGDHLSLLEGFHGQSWFEQEERKPSQAEVRPRRPLCMANLRCDPQGFLGVLPCCTKFSVAGQGSTCHPFDVGLRVE